MAALAAAFWPGASAGPRYVRKWVLLCQGPRTWGPRGWSQTVEILEDLFERLRRLFYDEGGGDVLASSTPSKFLSFSVASFKRSTADMNRCISGVNLSPFWAGRIGVLLMLLI
jgi:hypothetical protein